MLKIREIKAKSIIVKSGLPDSDYVINPYVGCSHGCIYCYARFMKRFTNHPEPWGQFVDVKINAEQLVPQNTKKFRDKSIGISSVTDAYQPLERKYGLMRGILKNLIPLQPEIWVLTKSDLVTRDIDLFRKLKKISVGLSISLLNDKTRKEVEPFAPSIEKRINALKELRKAGIKNFLFISPLWPELTDWREIVEKTKDFVDEYWFENLNLYPSIWLNIQRWLKKYHHSLLNKFQEIYWGKESDYWDKMEKEIEDYGKKNKLNFKIYFHHRNLG